MPLGMVAIKTRPRSKPSPKPTAANSTTFITCLLYILTYENLPSTCILCEKGRNCLSASIHLAANFLPPS